MTVSSTDGIAWITGASSGIGRGVALRLAQDGWTVVASARRADLLDTLAEEAQALPGRIVPAPCDITDLAAVKAVVESAEAEHGPIALAMLNAGTFKPESAKDLDSSVFADVMDLNVNGTVRCLEAVLPGMIGRKRGQIAIVSSVAGYRGLPSSLSYGASKAALINLCEALRFDLRRLGITVQVVNPGFVRTPLTDKNKFPMPFLVELDRAADKIVRGFTRGAFEIAFPLPLVVILKTMRLLPYWLYFPLIGRRTGR